MDIGRIVQMIINTVLRKVINGAVNKGFGMFARRGRSGNATEPQDSALPDDAAQAAKRARQAANLAKRLR